MKYVYIFLFTLFSGACQGETSSEAASINKGGTPAFELVTLGDTGGIKDGNLSAFLLRSVNDENYVALDAGSLVNGIDVALANNAFSHLTTPPDPKLQANGNILHHHVKAYLISHGHLDHVAGLLIASPSDNNKTIYALESVNKTMSDTYFNWQAWANFTNRGIKPQLNKYDVVDLAPQQTSLIKDTQLKVTAFSLSHPLESTAFVIENQNDMFVYFGDTGPDEVEKQGKLAVVWQYLANSMEHKRLRGMVIEVSFDNKRPDNLLFGHLTPKYLMQELTKFHLLAKNKTQFEDMKIVISHIKYSLKSGENPRKVVAKQLQEANTLGFHFILAQQGQVLML